MTETPFGFCAASPAAAHVFVDAPALHADVPFWIEGGDGHHLERVRRLRVGEAVTASDGRGMWRAYVVSELGEGRVRLAATGVVTNEPALHPRLAVAFAPPKGDAAATVVAQLTELGVDRIMPVETRRSVLRWEGARAERAAGRLRRVAREAAMQCRRARIPEVALPGPLAALTGHPDLVLAARQGAPVTSVPAPGGGEWLVLVGPEGGLDPSEVEGLTPRASLAVGPYVLRSVTAPVAIAAALSAFRRPAVAA